MTEDEKNGFFEDAVKAPGATVSYSLFTLLSRLRRPGELFCPVVDVAPSGVRFLTKKLLKFRSPVELEISLPGEKIPFTLQGRVVWSSINHGKTYRYVAGVAFGPPEAPGGREPGELLQKISALKGKLTVPGQDGPKLGP